MQWRKQGHVVLTVAALALGIGLGTVPLSADAQGTPTAGFTLSPTRPDVNTAVTFDASESSGEIARYEWDLDGDGSYEVQTESPVLVHLFEDTGSREVSLRVTGREGETATASHSLTVRGAPVTIRRSIETPLSSHRVPAGSSFEVTVTVKVNEPVSGLGLDEELPEGWRAGEVESAGGIFKGTEAQWLWLETLNPGTELVIVYSVTVPRDTQADSFILKGLASSFSPRFEITIPGESEVLVI